MLVVALCKPELKTSRVECLTPHLLLQVAQIELLTQQSVILQTRSIASQPSMHSAAKAWQLQYLMPVMQNSLLGLKQRLGSLLVMRYWIQAM